MTTTSISAPAHGSRPLPPRRPGPVARAGHGLRRHWYALAMVTPVLLVMAVLVVYPLAHGLYLSLTNATGMNVGRTIGVNTIPATYDFVGLDNYLDILSGSDGKFYSRLVWTVIWTASCVLLHYGIGLGLATLLNRPMRFRTGYRLLLILPWAVPAFVAAFSWRLILNGNGGVLNALLGVIGITGADWLANPFTAQLSVIAVNVWLGVPFMMVALLGGLQSVPGDLYEAAEVDGASPWQRFLAVTLPGLRPVSGTVVLLGVIWTFNQFPVIALVTGGGPGGATDILVTEAYTRAFVGVQNFSGSATYGAIILSLLVVFASVYRRFLNRSAGAAT